MGLLIVVYIYTPFFFSLWLVDITDGGLVDIGLRDTLWLRILDEFDVRFSCPSDVLCRNYTAGGYIYIMSLSGGQLTTDRVIFREATIYNTRWRMCFPI